MARVDDRVPLQPARKPEDIPSQRQIENIIKILNSEIEFGEPQDPEDLTSTKLAGATGTGAHNGTPGNILGSWVEIQLTSTGITETTCNHNLYINEPDYTVPVTGQPNCRWSVWGVQHDGTAADATSFLDVGVSFLSGTVSANAVDLRFNLTSSGTAATVDADHPVLVTLFFIRATRGE